MHCGGDTSGFQSVVSRLIDRTAPFCKLSRTGCVSPVWVLAFQSSWVVQENLEQLYGNSVLVYFRVFIHFGVLAPANKSFHKNFPPWFSFRLGLKRGLVS